MTYGRESGRTGTAADAEPRLRLRPAVPADLPLLRRWDEAPHVIASDPNDDWQ